MRDDLGDERFVFFFGILFVEDTIGFITQADASENIFTIETQI